REVGGDGIVQLAGRVRGKPAVQRVGGGLISAVGGARPAARGQREATKENAREQSTLHSAAMLTGGSCVRRRTFGGDASANVADNHPRWRQSARSTCDDSPVLSFASGRRQSCNGSETRRRFGVHRLTPAAGRGMRRPGASPGNRGVA